MSALGFLDLSLWRWVRHAATEIDLQNTHQCKFPNTRKKLLDVLHSCIDLDLICSITLKHSLWSYKTHTSLHSYKIGSQTDDSGLDAYVVHVPPNT